MRTAFSVFLSGLMALFFACRNSGSDNGATGSAEASDAPVHSTVHFAEAEQNLAGGNYNHAAAHLHKGIIAYRSETGKMHGNSAMRANRAIDMLTRLRKNLREGKAVNPADLHFAIEHALAVESPPLRLPSRPSSPDRGDLIVPVSGH